MLVWQNMHTHTRLSYCGGRDSTVANTVAEAESVGLRLIGICDHVDVPESGREALMAQNRDELAQIETPVRVLIGAEVTLVAPDVLGTTRDALERMDYVVISANHFHLPHVAQPEQRTEEGYADRFLTMAEAAIGFGASIIPHPFSYIGVRQMGDGRLVDRERLLAAYDRGRVRRLFRLAAERGTAFELNPGHVRAVPDFFAEMVRMGRDEGMKFSFGTDGHHPGQMHYGGPEALAQIERLYRCVGVTEADVCAEFAVRLDATRDGGSDILV